MWKSTVGKRKVLETIESIQCPTGSTVLLAYFIVIVFVTSALRNTVRSLHIILLVVNLVLVLRSSTTVHNILPELLNYSSYILFCNNRSMYVASYSYVVTYYQPTEVLLYSMS